MACSLDPNENLAKAEWRIREAAGKGAQIICLQELFRSQYFCREEDIATVRSRRADSRALPPSASRKLARELRRRDHRLAVRAPRRRALSQHRGGHRRRRRAARALSQDAHPRRSAVLTRSIYFTPGDLGLPLLRHDVRRASARWSAGTSGIPKARAWPRSAARRFCSIPPRSAGIPSEKARVRRGAARRLADHPALARDRQRRLRRGGEPRRATKGRRSTGSSSGAASFVADPFGRVLAEALARPRKRS